MGNLRAGKMNLQINGKVYNAIGDFTLNLGQPKREELLGPDGMHGYSEMPQAARITGEIRDGDALNAKNEILNMTNGTVTVKHANGKTYMVEEAFYCGDGDMSTEEGKIQFECKGMSGDEAPA